MELPPFKMEVVSKEDGDCCVGGVDAIPILHKEIMNVLAVAHSHGIV